MDTVELYVPDNFEVEYLNQVNNPLNLLLRFRELVIPVGFVDGEKLKKEICSFIDDCGLTHF